MAQLQPFDGIAHYLTPKMERLIVRALRLYVEEFNGAAPEEEVQMASDYADALENDTYLLETATPRDDTDDEGNEA